jgi:hypothetical protein
MLETQKPRPIASLLGLIAGALLVWGATYYINPPPSFDKQLVTMANEINKTCPIVVDEDTRLDNVMALPGKTVQYNLTILAEVTDEIDTAAFKEIMLPTQLNMIKTNPGMKTFRDNDVTLVYSYSDNKGNYLLREVITPEMYNK